MYLHLSWKQSAQNDSQESQRDWIDTIHVDLNNINVWPGKKRNSLLSTGKLVVEMRLNESSTRDELINDMARHKLQCSRIDTFDVWALRKIMRIPHTRHVTNVEVRATTGCHPLSHLVTDRRLRLFGHTARSSPQEDHHRAVAAVIRGLSPDQIESYRYEDL